MPDIKCPNCGTVFSVDDMTYASIARQVRDEEFEKELESQRSIAVKLVEAEKDQIISTLQAQVDGFQMAKSLAIYEAIEEKQSELAQKDQEIIGLQAQLKGRNKQQFQIKRQQYNSWKHRKKKRSPNSKGNSLLWRVSMLVAKQSL